MSIKQKVNLELTDEQLKLLTQALKLAKQNNSEKSYYVTLEEELAINLILVQLL